MAVGVGTGKQRRMPGSSARVRIIVIAVGEVGAVVEELAESALAELVAIALQIVSAKLVDDNYHNQLGMGIVGRGETCWKPGQQEHRDENSQRRRKNAGTRRCRSGEGSHREVSLHRGRFYANGLN